MEAFLQGKDTSHSVDRLFISMGVNLMLCFVPRLSLPSNNGRFRWPGATAGATGMTSVISLQRESMCQCKTDPIACQLHDSDDRI